MSRPRRLTLLTRLLGSRPFGSQAELAKALARSGVAVTQATLSRDLRGLGVLKRPDGSGRMFYALPGPAGEVLDRDRLLLDLKAFVNDVRVAQSMAIVKTPPGHASAVARAIDLGEFHGVVGTVAGDDTVLVVAEDAAAARQFRRRLDSLAAAGASARK